MFSREDLIKALMIFRIRFSRGQMWLYMGKDIIMLVVGMYVINEMLLKAGIELPQTLLLPMSVLAGVCYLAACYVVGLLDETYGTWKAESHYSTEELNPYMKQMMEKVDCIMDSMKK
jgi:hypothetical protein